MSAMGAVADEWVPILPGTEGAVALAIGRIMVEQKIGNAANSPVAGVLAGRRRHGGFAQRHRTGAPGAAGPDLRQLSALDCSARRHGCRPDQRPGGRHRDPGAECAGRATLGRTAGPSPSRRRPSTRCWRRPPQPPIPTCRRSSTGCSRRGRRPDGAGQSPDELPLETNSSRRSPRCRLWYRSAPRPTKRRILSDMILPDHNYLESWGYQAVDPGHRPANGDRPAARRAAPVRHPRNVGRDPGVGARQWRRGGHRPALPEHGRVSQGRRQPSWPGRARCTTRPTARRSGPVGASSAAGGRLWKRPSSQTRRPACPAAPTVRPASYEGQPGAVSRSCSTPIRQ